MSFAGTIPPHRHPREGRDPAPYHGFQFKKLGRCLRRGDGSISIPIILEQLLGQKTHRLGRAHFWLRTHLQLPAPPVLGLEREGRIC